MFLYLLSLNTIFAIANYGFYSTLLFFAHYDSFINAIASTIVVGDVHNPFHVQSLTDVDTSVVFETVGLVACLVEHRVFPLENVPRKGSLVPRKVL